MASAIGWLPAGSFWRLLAITSGSTLFGFSIVGVLAHWFLAETIINYVKDIILDSVNLLNSGICGFHENSRKVDYEKMLNNNKCNFVIIGIHYDSNLTFFKEYDEILKDKLKRGLKIVICYLDQSNQKTQAYQYIEKTEKPHIEEHEKLISTVNASLGISGTHKNIRYKKHQSILRYSFVYSSELIWLKFYPSKGYQTRIPALSIGKGSNFFKFLKQDIERLVEIDTSVKEGDPPLKIWLGIKND